MDIKPVFLDFEFPKSKAELQLDNIDKGSITSSSLQLLNECAESYFQSRFTFAKDVADELLNYTWEKLNTGNWKDVSITWRKLYGYGSLLKAASLCGLLEECTDNKQRHELVQAAIEACDMGLLMGAPILDNILSRLASILQSTSISLQDQDTGVCLNSIRSKETVTVERRATKDTDEASSKKQKTCHQPILDPEQAIPRLVCPALLQFKTQYMDKKVPVVLQGVMDHWPAMTHRKWSLEYLQQVAGSRTVPIEIGSKYTDDSWSQALMTLSEFIDIYMPSQAADDDNRTKGYLAQHQLFEQVPKLKQDICIPDYCCLKDTSNQQKNPHQLDKTCNDSSKPPDLCCTGEEFARKNTHEQRTCEQIQNSNIQQTVQDTRTSNTDPRNNLASYDTIPGGHCGDVDQTPGRVDEPEEEEEDNDEEDVDINAWFGPKGTVSPLHHDPKHNCLAQVVGEKYIRLYSEEMTEFVYPHEGYLLNNTSQVNVEAPDKREFPLFKKARYQECILQPGEMLYIPPKCWHYVRSLSTSFSVSFWWR